MRAMVSRSPGGPLVAEDVPMPIPAAGQLLVRIHACGVCRTDLHVIDRELPGITAPVIPGHEVVGRVVMRGPDVSNVDLGIRVGVPWLGWTCGTCRYCRDGHENLCDQARFHGYQLPGGYAEYMVVDQRYCFPLSDAIGDAEAAPLLCAGLIGYRAYRMAGNVRRLGIYGFGAAAHIVTQIAVAQAVEVYAFTRPQDHAAQDFARQLGAAWAGGSDLAPPDPLDAAIIFAPDGDLLPIALRAVRKGGHVICAGIHMSDIPSFPYGILWGERRIQSVANLTRSDAREFLDLLRTVSVRAHPVEYRLADANRAVADLRNGKLQGAAVLVV